MFNSVSHACDVIDVLTDVWDGPVINILVDVLMIDVWADVVVIGVFTDVKITVVPGMGVDDMTTALEFVMSVSLEKYMFFCETTFDC